MFRLFTYTLSLDVEGMPSLLPTADSLQKQCNTLGRETGAPVDSL
jgi:hypothetical protein